MFCRTTTYFDNVGTSLIFFLNFKTVLKLFRRAFKASPGWWHKYSKKYDLGSVTLLGEAASADHEAAAKFPAELKEFIEKEGFLEDQIFNVDETGIF